MKSIKLTILSLVVLLSLSYLWTRNSSANPDTNPQATLTEVKGTVEILKLDEEVWLPAVENLPLSQGDRLKTGAASAAEVTLDNGTVMKIEDNSDLSLVFLTFSTNREESTLELKKGKLISNVKKGMSGLIKTKIRTLNCVASVRGTEFVVVTDEENTNVGVFSGNVDVANLTDSGEESPDLVQVTPDLETNVKLGTRPSLPSALSSYMSAYRDRVNKLAHRAEYNRNRMQNLIQTREKVHQKIIRQWTKVREDKIKRILRDRPKKILPRTR